MRPTVYIETTIPSYYCDDREDLMRDILRTREWWNLERLEYECLTSLVVIDELASGHYPSQARCLDLVAPLPLLEVTDDVLDVAKVYHSAR